MDTVKPFDMITVELLNVRVMGRPVEWDREITTIDGRDKNGEYAKPIKFETTCPHCGQLTSFPDNRKSVKCTQCLRGIDQLEIDEFVDPFGDPGEFVLDPADDLETEFNSTKNKLIELRDNDLGDSQEADALRDKLDVIHSKMYAKRVAKGKPVEQAPVVESAAEPKSEEINGIVSDPELNEILNTDEEGDD